jgi:hypothetical protein
VNIACKTLKYRMRASSEQPMMSRASNESAENNYFYRR